MHVQDNDDGECRVLVDENMRSSTSMMNQQRAEVDAEMEENAVTATTYYNMHRLMRLYTESESQT